MTRRRAFASLGLALALITTTVAAADARPAALTGPVETYRVSIALPNRDVSSALVIVEHDGATVSGMMILDGIPAAALQKIRIVDNTLTADVVTSAGAARLTLELVDGTGTGKLVLREGK